jgi:hypothetical protein
MLRLKKIENTHYTQSVEIDKHIPFTIEWNYTSNKNSNNYWRTGDFEKSLFAIGLDSVTGMINNMTLTMSNIISIKEDDISISYSESGVPIFDLSQWPSNDFLDYSNRFLDCSNDFSVHLMKNRLSIRMNQDYIEKVVKSDRVLFHFGKDNILLGIDLVDINKDEHQTLKIALE